MGKMTRKHELESILSRGITWRGLALILLFAFALSWMADAVTFFCSRIFGAETANLVLLSAGFVIVTVLFMWWKRLHRKFPEADPTDIHEIGEPEPLPVLILFLSDYRRKDKGIETAGSDEELFGIDTNWYMPLKAVEHHYGRLERLYVLVSEKSAPQYGRFRQALERRFPGLRFEKLQTDIENMEAIKASFHAVFHSVAASDKTEEIVIDITGGNKLYSIAASYFALHGHRLIQYVDPKRGYRVRMFDNTIVPEEH